MPQLMLEERMSCLPFFGHGRKAWYGHGAGTREQGRHFGKFASDFAWKAYCPKWTRPHIRLVSSNMSGRDIPSEWEVSWEIQVSTVDVQWPSRALVEKMDENGPARCESLFQGMTVSPHPPQWTYNEFQSSIIKSQIDSSQTCCFVGFRKPL